MSPRPFQRLEHSLILLNHYLHPKFAGANDFRELKANLGDFDESLAPDGRSGLYHRLVSLPACKLSPVDLAQYDDNIERHLKTINASRPQEGKIRLKYFQRLALFYTEHVLHRTFLDRDNFLTDLNACVDPVNEGIRDSNHRFSEFKGNDLTKLAYWMATGSGKTLLMHINYHQILHYARMAGQLFDEVLLITPNAGLSDQHIAEFALSGIPALRHQSGDSRGNIFDKTPTVKVLEITKFSDKGGPTTVRTGAFDRRNLVFVDEGHRGASGEVWLKIRSDLTANNGFTFEYSATFGEAFNGSNDQSAFNRRYEYGKAIVFDYSYKYFHGDGYGKDYRILNLPKGFEASHADTLLTANLLTFYEQTRLFDDLGVALRAYHLERPLLVFVGHTVQTGKTKSQLNREDKASLSDVLHLTAFLNRVLLDEGGWVESTVEAILNNKADLGDESGRNVFAGQLDYLRQLNRNGESVSGLCADLRRRLFHANGKAGLHLVNLKNAPGEIALRAGNGEIYFGLINIGDDANFLKMTEDANLGLTIDEDALQDSMFGLINHRHSSINILLGAKKFIEGWSSWRVGAMGLLNVGRSEGSEIIQMFGRGVRLKGYNFSLKRSHSLEGVHPDTIPPLETLNIFSINGDYLSDFRKALDREGIATDFNEISVPVNIDHLYDPSKKTFDGETLYTIRPKASFDFSAYPPFLLTVADETLLPKLRPSLDLRPRLQLETGKEESQPAPATLISTPIPLSGLNLLNWDEIAAEISFWKMDRGYSNLIVNPTTLRKIIYDGCYTLHAPQSLLEPKTMPGMMRLQDTVLRLLKAYIDSFYKYRWQEAEAEHLIYVPLDDSDDNLRLNTLPDGKPGYIVKIPKDDRDLIAQFEALAATGSALYKQDVDHRTNYLNIHFGRHLYLPLLSASGWQLSGGREEPNKGQSFDFTPVGLTTSETRFVLELRKYLATSAGQSTLNGRRLFLLRNLSRGKGVGFFEAGNFYPDFILWLISDTAQRIIFVDPKGLMLLDPNDFSHPKIAFAETVKKIQSRLGGNIQLESFIVSETAFDTVQRRFGNRKHTEAEFIGNHVLFFDTRSNFLDVLLGDS